MESGCCARTYLWSSLQQKTPTQKEIRFPLALLPRTAGPSLPTQAFGGVWLNPKFGGLGKGRVWCGAQGRTQNIQGRPLQHFHSIAGLGRKVTLALG